MIPFPNPRLRPAARLAAGLVLLETLQRVVMLVSFRPAGAAPAAIAGTLLTGARADLATAAWAAVAPLLWLSLVPDRWLAARWHRRLALGAATAWWTLALFGAVADWFFFEEFSARLNVLAVDYLLYPGEIIGDIRGDYPLFPIAAGCVAAGALAALGLRRKPGPPAGVPLRARLADLGVGLAAFTLAAAAAPGAPPRTTGDRVLDELAGDGLYGFGHALVTRDLRWADHYRTLPPAEAFARARRLLASPGARFVDDPGSVERAIPGDPARPRLNVVVILAESFGSEFWRSLGGPAGLTPRMDALARDGLFFTRIYASGERTQRGMEGALASFPSLPGASLIRRPGPGPVATLARTLRDDGYDTVFIYGGRGAFDDMRPFCLAHGWNRFVEQRDYAHPAHVTIWGVSDEDLFAKALEELRARHAAGRPFFATILTVSNHKPYTYPRGRIPERPEDRNRANAVKYADWALGRFFDAARTEPFWPNTLFVLIADHGAHVYGSPRLPIRSHEVPLLIVGPAVGRSPSRIDGLGSSLDVPPTVLGLIGRPYRSVFFGRDLLAGGDGWALLNHNRESGMLRGRSLVTFGMGRSSSTWRYDARTRAVVPVVSPAADDLDAARDAIALHQAAEALLLEGSYHPAAR